jgi:hypothetical protein
MRPSRNIIEHTWLAYAFDRPAELGRIERALQRVGSHYGSLMVDPVTRRAQLGQAHGMALWHREDSRILWPMFHERDRLAMASPGLPTGWQRVTGTSSLAAAPDLLAARLYEDPTLSARLNPPALVGVRSEADQRLVVMTDLVGAGRAYELRTAEGWVWSNRLGALPIFAGTPPRADRAAWMVFAAAGWFLGTQTPIEGATKVPPAMTVVVTCPGPDGGAVVERRDSGARRDLVAPRRVRFKSAAEEAGEDTLGLARELGECWTEPLAISLTGGRDSRISAAASVAAGIPATYNTGDQVPGELDVVRELIAAAPVSMPHAVNRPDPDEEGDPLTDRIAAIHLMHDGMRNPQEIRRSTEIPHAGFLPPTLSGHGGELGHGFYYGSRAKLRKLGRGDDALMAQLERAARRRHSAATDEGYEAYLHQCGETLEEGRQFGLEGPTLLDWFYLAQRLPYRSGLGARSARWSACVTPGFIRGAFDLTARDRLSAKLHRRVIAQLVPEWRRIDFFSPESEAMPEIRRERIWEREQEAAVVEEMMEAGRVRGGAFREDRLREMWAEVRGGAGSADYEHIFDRLVWLVGFEDHLALLAERAVAA